MTVAVAVVQLIAWYALTTAWVYAQHAGASSGLIPRWWSWLLATALWLAPAMALASTWWAAALLSLPLLVAATLAWPMALIAGRLARSVTSDELEALAAEEAPSGADRVERVRACGEELERARQESWLWAQQSIREAG